MDVITNNVPRDVIYGWELTPAEREQFDYLDWPAIERGEDSASFFRYKGMLHHLGEFRTTWGLGSKADTRPEWLKDWDGCRSDSFFSALVVRYVEDNERVVVGLVLS